PPQPVPCSRTVPSTGFNDYLVLQNSNFLVCPSCYNTQVRPTPFASYFTPSPPQQYPVRCDLSRFWVKIAGACLITAPQKYDISLLPKLAALQGPDGVCPNRSLGSENELRVVQTRRWYALHGLEQWKVCGDCVVNMEMIWPELKGGWAVTQGQGACGLVTSERYDDMKTMETLKQLLTGGGVHGLVGWLRGNMPPPVITDGECPRNYPAPVGLKCHVMPGLHEFTVCERCFKEVVSPGVKQGMGLAVQFDGTARAIGGGWTCQLYSERMRQVWQQTSSSNDINTLRMKVIERKSKERELEMKTLALKQKAAQLKIQAETQQHLAVNAFRPDFSETQKLNNQAAMLKVEAAGIEGQIRMEEEQWRRYWE
ncbi:hypothetical protein QBC43DRAFT_168859, partial [Cladorrhinum sp. PSN259]